MSLEVDAGEVVAIVGPSGSGKSTLLACLAGLDEPDAGSVRVAGQVMTRRSEIERAAVRARYVGVLWQTANLLEHLRVRDNVVLAQRLAGRTDRAAATTTLERLGLATRATAWPDTLSGGEVARAGLAVALANDPPVVLADEPTGELDRAAARTVVGLLRAHADRERAVVIVTHSDDVAGDCDRVVHLRDGKVAP